MRYKKYIIRFAEKPERVGVVNLSHGVAKFRKSVGKGQNLKK
jgi:hypothetical protein